MQLTYLHLGTLAPAFCLSATYLLVMRKGYAHSTGFWARFMHGLNAIYRHRAPSFMEALVGPLFLNHFGYIHLLSLFVSP